MTWTRFESWVFRLKDLSIIPVCNVWGYLDLGQGCHMPVQNYIWVFSCMHIFNRFIWHAVSDKQGSRIIYQPPNIYNKNVKKCTLCWHISKRPSFIWFSRIFFPQVHPQHEWFFISIFKWKPSKCVLNLKINDNVVISSIFKILYSNCPPWPLRIMFLFLRYFETKASLKKMNLKRNPEKTGGKPRNLRKQER